MSSLAIIMGVNVVLIVVFVRLFSTNFGFDVHHQMNNVGIFGGHNISIEEVPFMASLRLNATHHYCGASIIHERFVLSAAHCILPNMQYNVQVGSSHVDKEGTLYDVEKIIKHELYNNLTNDYDISLIKLKTSLRFSTKVNKIALADRSVRLKKLSILDITGWGKTKENGDISKDLLQVKIPIVPTFNCQLLYLKLRQGITKRMLCAGGHGKDSCQGDSGGPLTLNNTIQVGITSFGYGCGSMPGVYTKITPMLSWIHATIEKNL